jgi:UDP-N-acetylmuramate dehydrogenase
MKARHRVALACLTTLHLGGSARRLMEVFSADEAVAAVAGADAAGEPLLVLGGGSNLVVADAGFDGTVVKVATRGVSFKRIGDRVRLVASAGESWDDLVARCVADGLAGIECLSGIPGLAGAAPIQNVGAYGQELAETVPAVSAYDREAHAVVELGPADCRFAYRSSVFKRSARYVVLTVTLQLRRSAAGGPVRYAELAGKLDVRPDEQPSLSELGEAVLALRRGKGMVVDPGDPDSVSAGSFFVNPILLPEQVAALRRRVHERLGDHISPPAWPETDGSVKTSAAWLIEQAGFRRGYSQGRVGISSKHTLALVNRGGATTAELLSLARELRDGVQTAFGITLQPEPTLVGGEL